MHNSEINKTDFNNFVIEIKQKILSKQYEALKSVNKELISLYWDIGKSIVEKQESLGWGKSVVKSYPKSYKKSLLVWKVLVKEIFGVWEIFT